MNIYLRELKAHRTGLIWWCVGMVALVASGMAKYGAYKSAGQSITAIFAQVPKTVQVVFGFQGSDLTTASGFFGVLFLYIAVMGAVHAALLGSHLISKEERDRTSEFLYSKPVSRAHALTAKLLAGLTDVIILNIATWISSIYFVGYYGKGESVGNEVALLMAGLLFLQLIFFAIGALVAGIVKKPKSAPSIATSIMFMTFLLSYLVNMNDRLNVLKYLSPFKYFDAFVLMTDGRLDPVFVILSVVITSLAVFGTYYFYSARDLNV
jgi:ABC-2 type transport system permease protein